MPKQLLNIPSFEGGLNTALDPRDISLSELSKADNVMCDINGIIKLQGTSISHSIPDIPISSMMAGYGLYRFESSFGGGAEVGSSPTQGAYSGACKFEHESGSNYTGENIWHIMSDAQENIYAHVPLDSGLWIEIGKINTGDTAGIEYTEFKPVYHIADEGLRISNASYDYFIQPDTPGTNLIKNRWFGFIQKKNYFLNSASTTDYYFNGWYFLDNDIKSPTAFNVSTGQYAADTVDDATAGAGFDLYIASDEGGNHDFSLAEANDGTVNYEFASSFIYDGIQESLLFQSGNVSIERVGTHTDPITSPGADASLQLAVGVTAGYNPRITGGRIYFRKYESNDEWVLLVDIDFEKGCRASLDDIYPTTPWTTQTAAEQDGTGAIFSSTPYVPVSANKPDTPIFSTFLNVDSYYTLNEWSPNEPRISIGCDDPNNDSSSNGNNYPTNSEGQSVGEGYKCSAIINRRCFIANTQLYKNESSGIATGSLFRERDRIYYSAVNRFDCFPRTTHFIDVVRGDAEEYTALMGYADRLLAFKTNTLYILNIAAQDPREWFLESQHKGMGVKKTPQVSETQDGIMWANDNGAYIYTGGDVRTTTTEDITIGSDINNITKNKISSTDWISETGHIGVGYISKRNQLLAIEDLGSDDAKQYIYDFNSKTWTGSHISSSIFQQTHGVKTNFILDGLGGIAFGSQADTTDLVTNGTFAPVLDGVDGNDNGDGTVDGYTVTKLSGTGDVEAFVDSGMHITLDAAGAGEGNNSTIARVEYEFASNLVANTEYEFVAGYFGWSYSTWIFWYIKEDGGNYESIGSGGSFGDGPNHFSGTFTASTSASHTLKAELYCPWNVNLHYRFNSLSLTSSQDSAKFFTFDNTNNIGGVYGQNRFNAAIGGIDIKTKDIDFGQSGIKKKVFAVYITHRTPTSSLTQTTPVSYATDGGTSFTNLTGNITATGGAWSVSKFYSATPIECQSIRFRITNPSAAGMLEINDMAIEYRQIHKRVA